MSLVNTRHAFGSITKMLHWSIFILFTLQFFLVYRREYFPKESPEKLSYLLTHKSIGVLVLVLAIVMLFWRHLGTRPAYPTTMNPLLIRLAKLTHVFLYLVMLIMPISGILMSQFSGYSVSFFNLYTLPTFFSKNEMLGDLFFEIHEYCSFAVMGIVGLHILGALVHQYIYKDNILKRMMPS